LFHKYNQLFYNQKNNLSFSDEKNDPSLSQFSKLLKCITKQQDQTGGNFGEMDFSQWQKGGQLPPGN
jgi:hypothetical protein